VREVRIMNILFKPGGILYWMSYPQEVKFKCVVIYLFLNAFFIPICMLTVDMAEWKLMLFPIFLSSIYMLSALVLANKYTEEIDEDIVSVSVLITLLYLVMITVGVILQNQ